jgi:citrate synthase
LVIDAVATAAADSFSAKPNVDFALGALAFATRMPLLATEAIFAIARTAGWIAHALEEYEEEPLRFRARAIYIGMAQTGSRLS